MKRMRGSGDMGLPYGRGRVSSSRSRVIGGISSESVYPMHFSDYIKPANNFCVIFMLHHSISWGIKCEASTVDNLEKIRSCGNGLFLKRSLPRRLDGHCSVCRMERISYAVYKVSLFLT